MAQYRLLTYDELKELEPEFVDYLVANGITADDWVRLKQEEKEKAEKIIELFSDVVFEGVMRKVEYLDYRAKKSVKSFQCLDDKMVLVGMTATEDSGVDFTDQASMQSAQQNPPEEVKVYTTEKPYSQKREHELFELVQAGAQIADGTLFKSLCLALPAK